MRNTLNWINREEEDKSSFDHLQASSQEANPTRNKAENEQDSSMDGVHTYGSGEKDKYQLKLFREREGRSRWVTESRAPRKESVHP